MATRKFKPSLVPSVIFFLVLPVLVSLGFWQLDRAAQKEALQTAYDERSRQSPVSLSVVPVQAADMRFRRIEATGVYDYAHEFLVDNRVLNRRVGYHVITPLQLTNSNTRVLVNRGWVLGNPDRTILPDTDGPAGTITVHGTAVVPHDKVFQLAKEPEIKQDWPRVWQRVNMKRFAGAVTGKLHPVVMLLDPNSEAGGFERDWKRLDTGIAVHQGYAFQWFSLAVALIAIFFLVSFKKQE